MEKQFKIGIMGGAGYTGGELIRLLVRHPHASISFVHSRSNAGKAVSSVHQDLIGELDLHFSEKINEEVDVLFLCAGHGEAIKFLDEHTIPEKIKIIDLSNDFRLAHNSQAGRRTFTYGLPELQKKAITKASNIANPGCFATAIQLGLLPLAKAGLLQNIYTTGITGSTGAGQGLTETGHFSWRSNNIQAYKTLNHQHVGEILQSIHQLQPSINVDLNFIPWRGDFTRGIFISSQLDCDWPVEKLTHLFEEYYSDHPFTHVSRDSIFLKQVVNTNKCIVQLEKLGTNLVIHSALDNLLKGASGQAVQNMNLMLGLDECAGLNLKANYF